MDRLEIEKLRDLPIVGVAERLGLRVNSRRRQCLCPFHDDHHPSMSLGRNNKYRCFVCGAHGDVIELVMRHLQKSFPDACRWLADESNVVLTEYKPTETVCEAKPFDASRFARFFERPFLNDEARRFLFDERRLDPRVVSWCRLTSWHDRQGVAWLETPYYDHEGRLVGIQNRNLVRGALPRFRFPSGSWCGVYNLPVLNRLRQGEDLYITEGCSDCWAMLSAGHKAIAIPSATLLTKEVRNQLETCNLQLETHFHMYPDRDEPGERLFLQLKEVLPSLVHHQLPPGCKDFSDYYLSVR